MRKYSISVVSYTNTLPFRVGIETNPYFHQMADIYYDYPAVCAQKLKNDEVDVGLVPVALLPELDTYQIIGNYCIGAVGRVDTVQLYGNVPVENMKEVLLDYQSRTSVELMKLLARKFWNISPKWTSTNPGFIENKLPKDAGMVVIGDRNFLMKNKFAYEYDLAQIWYEYSGLPFVFAVWVSKKPVSDEFEKVFDATLKQGITRINDIVQQYQQQAPEGVDLNLYLNKRISYSLDTKKRKALDVFLTYLNSH
ncbi:MAG: menaquinone biosynthesis protein [Salinivirgaceae bacterium]|jgi:chorismate dehydratase|nr:menaquinone biosynthesis protein [Salinivirgaceae bacterium]